ncbi:MAG: hypothetical protein CR217_05655 [Beijerinckiaceae bacterium]|nr:MAG: hypothetical protein CR217_05655 [Beijerinckiaceae bacterium]
MKRPAPRQGTDPLELSFPSGIDNQANSRNRAAAQAQISRVRRQRLVENLHRLGPAPLFHLLTDLGAGKPVWPTVERYAALPADFIRAYGGDRFPVAVIRLVPRGSP